MELFRNVMTQINKAKYKEKNIQDIDYQAFYNDTSGKLVIIYNEQIIQNHLFKEKVNNTAKNIREVIKKCTQYNLWNTYLLIIVDKNPFDEKYYYIERDVRNLRKYVIQNESDILRIPFLNLVNTSKDVAQVESSVYSASKEINELYIGIKNKGGGQKKLTKTSINKILSETKFLEGELDG